MANCHDLFMECFDKIEHVSKHWRELGLRLRVKNHQLDAIESNYPRNVVRCKMDMLSTWLRSSPADPAAELDAALDKLKHTVHVIGDHEKKVTLDHDIQTRIGKLKGDYADIVVKALRWLNTRYPEDRDAVRWLNEILRGLQREPLVLPRKSISDKIPLDDQLQERWSFTNPAVLRRLVRETHDSNLNEQMDKYIEDFKDVRSSIPISDQELKKELIFEPFEPDKPCLILVLERITYFGDIDVFLKEVFDIYTRFFRIHKIEPGCIKVTLQFDTSMESHIQARIDDKYEAVKHYAKMHIISNKKQTEPSEDATSIDEENNGSCIEEVTKEHRTQLLLCAESRHDKSRERLWKTYAGKQSPVYTRTKFRKRAYSTNASSKEELCKRIEKPINSKYMQSTVVCNNPTHAS